MTEKEMLDTVVEWFSADPEGRRSISPDGHCKYDPPEDKPNSKGCAIGMFISTKEDRAALDNSGISGINLSSNIYSVFDDKRKQILPDWIQEMNIDFLVKLQSLHDEQSNWTQTGLSQSGIEQVNQIRKQFKLE